MKVHVLAHTVFNTIPQSILYTPFGARLGRDLQTDEHNDGLDLLHEFAGRACYQSWNTPNPSTAENEGYLRNIIEQGHFSVLEHGSVTFYVEGVSRSLTHELIRHRHLSFSELSQRYVNVAEADMVVPPAIRDLDGINGAGAEMSLQEMGDEAAAVYEGLVARLHDRAGLPRKQAREAARAVMPNMTETKIVVTGNLRAWRDVLSKRWHVAADAEIREFAGLVLGHLRDVAPGSVQDIPDEPYGGDVT